MNSINVIGRLTRDPEMAFVGDDNIPRTRFTVAVPRGYGEQATTDFIPVVAWRGLAEAVAKYTNKGDLVGVTGSLRVRSYKTETGESRTHFEIIADAVRFLTPRKNGDAAAPEGALIPDEVPPPAPTPQESKAKTKGK